MKFLEVFLLLGVCTLSMFSIVNSLSEDHAKLKSIDDVDVDHVFNQHVSHGLHRYKRSLSHIIDLIKGHGKDHHTQQSTDNHHHHHHDHHYDHQPELGHGNHHHTHQVTNHHHHHHDHHYDNLPEPGYRHVRRNRYRYRHTRRRG